jgi:hypothetical protein
MPVSVLTIALDAAPVHASSGPSWTDYASAIAGMFAATVGVPTVLFAAQQLRSTRRVEVAQLLAILGEYVRQWDATDMLVVRQEVGRLGPDGLRDSLVGAFSARPEIKPTVLRVADYFEYLGWSVAMSNQPLQFIDAALGDAVIDEWSKWQPSIQFLRQTDSRQVYSQFERLTAQLVALRTHREDPKRGAVYRVRRWWFRTRRR